jgi:hypothetical protein
MPVTPSTLTTGRTVLIGYGSDTGSLDHALAERTNNGEEFRKLQFT